MELYLPHTVRDILVYTGILLLVVYFYFTSRYNYWKNRNFPYLKPKFPLGNNKTLLCKFLGPQYENFDYYEEIKRKGYKFAGVFSIVQPNLVVVDPEVVKDILVKDFNYFADRNFYKTKFDPLSLSLFNMEASEWKEMRMKLTPTFTSGKLKMMIPSIILVSQPIIKKIDNMIMKNADVNIKEIATTFTINTLATCALGIEASNGGRDIDIFTEMTEKHSHTLNFSDIVRYSFIDRFPDISSKIGVNFLRKEVSDFFRKVVKESMACREETGLYRPDFLELLINIKNKSKVTSKPITDDELAAEVFLFFLASLDTSASAVLFSLYELSNHPELQERTRKEIITVLEKHDGQINSDSLNEMKYLRQVIDESLRLYPPLPSLDRKCVQNYKIRETDLIVEKGININISIFGIHRDPDNYPEPEKFDPERFNEENKKNIRSGIYLPFGMGPRNCIGLRFGMLLTQIALVEILKNFRMSISSATQLPLEFDKQHMMLTSKNPILFKAERLRE